VNEVNQLERLVGRSVTKENDDDKTDKTSVVLDSWPRPSGSRRLLDVLALRTHQACDAQQGDREKVRIPDKIPRLPELFNDPGLRKAPYQPIEKKPVVIVAAAIKKGDFIWTGRRHAEIIPMVIEDVGETVKSEDQGFFTDSERFVNRREALAIVQANGQVPKSFNKSTLLSEHLW
jgi:hypothetical protein